MFKNCNNAAKGGIFYLSSGARLNVTSNTRAMDNSALYGGFAYLTDPGTTLLMNYHVKAILSEYDVEIDYDGYVEKWKTKPVKPIANLAGQNAYFGGAFYVKD